jgi:hypothetical protein
MNFFPDSAVSLISDPDQFLSDSKPDPVLNLLPYPRWKKVVAASWLGFPLCNVSIEPPLDLVTFMSDAAGTALAWVDGVSKNVTIPGDRGVAAVGHTGADITSICILRWPDRLMIGQKSRSGSYFGSKSATLETVGLLPFLTQPETVRRRYVLLQVDNTAVLHAWRKKYSVTDPETSLLIRALHIIEAFLNAKFTSDTFPECRTRWRLPPTACRGNP